MLGIAKAPQAHVLEAESPRLGGCRGDGSRGGGEPSMEN